MNAPVARPIAGKPDLLLGNFELSSLGYGAQEFFLTGSATSYVPTAEFGPDGQWPVAPSGAADYVTRMVVLKPADARFSGTVVVEWLNVTGGMDAPAEWFMAHREIVRAGHAYVGVSAQRVGVEGGPSRGTDLSLKTVNPKRYGELLHPGDQFSFDIFSQAGRLLRNASANGLLGDLLPRHLLAVGESQSAMFLVTYVNAIDPMARVYDGFLVHSRFASAGPLDGSSMFGAPAAGWPAAPKIRSDLRVPLITVITETDLLGGARPGYHLARQPDADRLRTWEISGAAHADNYIMQVSMIDTGVASLEDLVAAYAPTRKLMGAELPEPINFAPQHHYVVQAAVAALQKWVASGEPAPGGPGIELDHAVPPGIVPDERGLAQGGIRTPWIDVPIARTSGLGSNDGGLASLFGSGQPFDANLLGKLYPRGLTDYLARFEASLDTTIASGFVLAADRQEILALAAALFAAAPPAAR